MVKRALLACALLWAPLAAFGAETAPAVSEADAVAEEARAPVMLDGETLFSLRGTSSQPAEKRAAAVSERIRAAAADKNVAADSLRATDVGLYTVIAAGDRLLIRLVDADAETERLSRPIQAELYQKRIAEAMTDYRRIRTPRALLVNAFKAIAATLVAGLLIWVVRRVFRGLEWAAERRLKTHFESLQQHSHHIIQAKPLQAAIGSAVRAGRLLALFFVVLLWLNIFLGCFPLTRQFARHLFSLLLGPLEKMGFSLAEAIPNLIFLTVLVVVTRYVLKVVKLYFDGLERGSITMDNFDRDWAGPTYRIVRLLIISFAAVIAYPYIPGSNSDAFKGVSLFLGVVFSLGSSSVISNMIAGYSLTYRRVFKVSDRVRIGEVYGDVVESGLMVTRVRTPKNEDVVVPNSTILNNDVMNYSTMARQGNLILHTTVGVGYATPWRQVEAMLKLAVARTPGLLKQPAPFVLQLELGDFSVKYEINAYCDDAQKGPLLYTVLHQNILDLFNEHGVQIMTPAYEGDPEAPKVVPKEKWFVSPAEKNGQKETV